MHLPMPCRTQYFSGFSCTFVFCSGDCPFKSEPSPTSAHAYGEVTGQDVGMCSTRGGSQGMYITFASAIVVLPRPSTLHKTDGNKAI